MTAYQSGCLTCGLFWYTTAGCASTHGGRDGVRDGSEGQPDRPAARARRWAAFHL